MAWIRGEFHEQFTTSATAEAACTAFANLDTIIANYGPLENAEKLDTQAIRFTLEEQNHGITTFQGTYTCRYVTEGVCLTWSSEGTGNIKAEGTATFTPSESGATIDYRASLELDMSVNAMIAKMIAPIVGAAIQKEMKAYVERMIAAAEA